MGSEQFLPFSDKGSVPLVNSPLRLLGGSRRRRNDAPARPTTLAEVRRISSHHSVSGKKQISLSLYK